MNLPFVSIIVPTYSDWDRLELCINALSKQSYSHQKFEVIIVNNEPMEAPYEVLPHNFSIITELEPGSYAARNRGIQQARGEILGFTDSDCIPGKAWIERAVYHLTNSEVDRIAGHVEMFLSENVSTPASIYDNTFSFRQEIHAKSGTSVTANMFSRKRVFEDIGYFDADLKSGADKQWGFCANEAGYSIVYAHDVVVRHPLRTEITEIVKKARRVYGGQFMEKGWDTNHRLVNLLLSITAFRPPLRALGVIISNRKISFREKLLVIRVLFKVRCHLLSEHLELTFGKTVER